MVDRHQRHCLARRLALTLLVVSGFTVATATAAVTSDSRLPDAARTQDAKAVRGTTRTITNH